MGRLSLETKVLLIVVIAALALRLWPLGGVSIDYDEGVYWQSLRALASGHTMFSSVFSSQPPLFLLCLYPFYLLFGQTLIAARLAIIIYSLVGILALYWVGRLLGGRWVGVLACALLATDPLYLTESITVQAEVPALAFEILCVALAVAATRREGRARKLLAMASGLALALGTMVKLFDVVAVVPAALYLAQPLFAPYVTADGQRLRLPARDEVLRGLRAVLPDLIAFVLAALAAALVVLLPFVSSFGALYDQAVRFHLAAGHTVNNGTTYNIKLIAGAGSEYALAGLALVAIGVALWRRGWNMLPPMLWLAASLVVLVRQQPLLAHHVTLLVPPLALTAALALPLVAPRRESSQHTTHASTSNTSATARPAWMASALLVLLMLGMLAGLIVQIAQDNIAAQPPTQTEAQMAAALHGYTLPGDLVVTDNQYIAGLADRNVPPQLVDTSQVRIQSGYLTTSQVENIVTHDQVTAVLFASGRFDMLPGFRAWVAANFSQQLRFGPKQTLYYNKSPSEPALTRAALSTPASSAISAIDVMPRNATSAR